MSGTEAGEQIPVPRLQGRYKGAFMLEEGEGILENFTLMFDAVNCFSGHGGENIGPNEVFDISGQIGADGEVNFTKTYRAQESKYAQVVVF